MVRPLLRVQKLVEKQRCPRCQALRGLIYNNRRIGANLPTRVGGRMVRSDGLHYRQEEVLHGELELRAQEHVRLVGDLEADETKRVICTKSAM